VQGVVIVVDADNGYPLAIMDSIEITITSATRFILSSADVRPGMFIAAVGADNEHKWEIDPALFSRAKVVVDNLNQCASIGDLHHAIEAGTVTRDAVHADLGSVAAGTRPGRESDDEITLFDSTGIALQDAVTGALVLRESVARNLGRSFDLFA
jgi:alanine dehydrogenase